MDDAELEVRTTSVIACSLHKKLTGVLRICGSVESLHTHTPRERARVTRDISDSRLHECMYGQVHARALRAISPQRNLLLYLFSILHYSCRLITKQNVYCVPNPDETVQANRVPVRERLINLPVHHIHIAPPPRARLARDRRAEAQ